MVDQSLYNWLQTIPVEHILLGVALLILASIGSSKLAGRLGVPTLLLFLLVGMLAGSDGPGGLYFNDAWLSQVMGVTALAIILFAGGLSTDWPYVKPILWPAVTLATVGVLITAILMGLFIYMVLGFPLLEAMLLGSVISSTDAAAVFAVLRSKQAALKGRLAPLLELESGANDPMAVFLTIGFIQLITQPSARLASMAVLFVLQMVLGLVIGYIVGRGIVVLLNRINLEYDGLYPVLLLGCVMFTYSATAALKGSGFLAVYVAGIVMGNSHVIHKRSLSRFYDALAWLMQIMMFLTLGLLVFPSHLIEVAGFGLAVSAFLMFVARPAAVFLLLSFTRMTFREKLLIAWVGLRGAVPIVLATLPLLAGVPEARTIFNVVFFVVITSALFQGTSIPLVARWLGVAADMVTRPAAPLELHAADHRSDLWELVVPTRSPAAGKPIVQLGLPSGILIALINRGDEYIVPTGSTTLEAGDTIMVLGDKECLPLAKSALGAEAPGLI